MLMILLCYSGMFKEAEISASISSGSSRSIEAAQKKGSTILNLKCVDVQVMPIFPFQQFSDIFQQLDDAFMVLASSVQLGV